MRERFCESSWGRDRAMRRGNVFCLWLFGRGGEEGTRRGDPSKANGEGPRNTRPHTHREGENTWCSWAREGGNARPASREILVSCIITRAWLVTTNSERQTRPESLGLPVTRGVFFSTGLKSSIHDHCDNVMAGWLAMTTQRERAVLCCALL